MRTMRTICVFLIFSFAVLTVAKPRNSRPQYHIETTSGSKVYIPITGARIFVNSGEYLLRVTSGRIKTHERDGQTIYPDVVYFNESTGYIHLYICLDKDDRNCEEMHLEGGSNYSGNLKIEHCPQLAIFDSSGQVKCRDVGQSNANNSSIGKPSSALPKWAVLCLFGCLICLFVCLICPIVLTIIKEIYDLISTNTQKSNEGSEDETTELSPDPSADEEENRNESSASTVFTRQDSGIAE